MNDSVVGALLDRLRTETRPQHASIEQRLDILAPSLTLERYRQILSDLHGFYEPVERRVGPYGGSPDWRLDDAPRNKLHLLKCDLRQIRGEADSRDSAAELPECDDLPSLDSVHDQLGCMYVLEGSTLGGQYVLKHVAKRFNFSAERGAAFFNSYGQNVGVNWRSFLRRMQERTSSADEQDEVVSSARQTFAKLEAWISRRDRAS